MHADARSVIDQCKFTLQFPESGIIQFRRLLLDHQRSNDWSSEDILIFASDACDTGLAALNIKRRSMIIIPLGPRLQAALRRTRNENNEMDDEKTAALIKVTIALPEFICILFICIQWRDDLRASAIAILRWFCDNENAVLWAQKGFAGNPIAQHICRVLGAFEHLLGVITRSIYISTLANITSDLSSRIFDDFGNIIPGHCTELLERNASLSHPYQLEQPCSGVCTIIAWLESASHVYGDMPPPPPLSELLDMGDVDHTTVPLSQSAIQASASKVRAEIEKRLLWIPSDRSCHSDSNIPGSLANLREAFTWQQASQVCLFLTSF